MKKRSYGGRTLRDSVKSSCRWLEKRIPFRLYGIGQVGGTSLCHRGEVESVTLTDIRVCTNSRSHPSRYANMDVTGALPRPCSVTM